MESKTYLKNLRIAPKKLRFFLPVLKKKAPAAALDYLYYSPERAAKVLYQALKSALTNAKNVLKVDENLLEWKLLTIEEGHKQKRWRPGGRGTAKPFRIRFSHVKIVLGAKQQPKVKEVEQKKEIKAQQKPVTKVSTKGRSPSGRKK